MVGHGARGANASQPDKTLSTRACRDAFEDTGLGCLGIELDVSAAGTIINPANSSLSILRSAHLVLKNKCTIRRHCFSQRAVCGIATDFEGNVLEESVLCVSRVIVIGTQLGTISESEDVAVPVLNAEIVAVSTDGIGEVLTCGAGRSLRTFAVQPDHSSRATAAGLRGFVTNEGQAGGAASPKTRSFILRPILTKGRYNSSTFCLDRPVMLAV